MIARQERVWTKEEIVAPRNTSIIELLMGNLDDTALEHMVSLMITAFGSRKEKKLCDHGKNANPPDSFPHACTFKCVLPAPGAYPRM